MLGGCESVKEYVDSPDTATGQLTVFLKGPDEASTDITFQLEAINIIAADGTSREIMSVPREINSIALVDKQILLTENTVPSIRYKKLQLIVKEAFIKRKDGIAHLALPEDGIYIETDMTVLRNQTASIFLSWNADDSVADGYLFQPALIAKGQVPELSSLLIYVTNEGSDNVSVINRQSGDVVATVMVGKKPRGVALSLDRKRPRVYVANSGSDSVSVIDPTTNKIELEVPIRFGTAPEGIAVAHLSPAKELIFVTNYGSDTVSVIDGSTYQETQKINVGNGPVFVAVDPPYESLSDARFLDFEDIDTLRRYRESFFNVYVVNKNSNDISVIVMDKTGNIIEEVTTVGVEWNPISLALDYQRGKMYVANHTSENLSVLDIVQIAGGNIRGSVSTIPNVGMSVIGVLSDPELDRIYLLKDSTNEIEIIKPFSEGLRTIPGVSQPLSPIIGSISVGNSPRSFMFDPENRNIFVVNRGSDTLSVINKTSNREERVIPVGKRPYGIAMFPF
jgi:YVTN family beta-propeller protein